MERSLMDPESLEGVDSTGLTRIRERRFWFSNPAQWNFSIFGIHVFKNILAYCRYFLLHKFSGPSAEELERHLPVAENSRLEHFSGSSSDVPGIQVLWIGHASLLVRIDGVNILFDPVFHDCGPVVCGCRVSGYKRFRAPAINVRDLRETHRIDIEAVCISHNHYDHLDLRSVEELEAAYPDSIQWLVPRGMKKWFLDRGCKKVIDFDWWNRWPDKNGNGTFSSYTATFTPAKHWSLRGLPDYYCRHLWGSWFLEGRLSSRFFFAGDTGYEKGIFEQIRKTCGTPDVAAIPIGAYKPRPVMRAQHINPEEAVQVHLDLGATHSIGIHWGTFAMSNEKINEPREDLAAAIEKFEQDTDPSPKTNLKNFIVLDHGEVRSFEVIKSSHERGRETDGLTSGGSGGSQQPSDEFDTIQRM